MLHGALEEVAIVKRNMEENIEHGKKNKNNNHNNNNNNNNNTLFMSQVYLAEHRGSTNWGDRKSYQQKSNEMK